MRNALRDWLEASALGNGNLRRFTEKAGRLPWGFLALHFFLVSLALHFPVLLAVARLPPAELFSRLYGADFLSLPAFREFAAAGGEPEEFNALVIAAGYGRGVLLPVLLVSFLIILFFQACFYPAAAFFLGLRRMTGSRLSFRERLGIFVMASTLPVIGAAVIGLWMPALHIIVFYLALIPLGFLAAEKSLEADRKRGAGAYTQAGGAAGRKE